MVGQVCMYRLIGSSVYSSRLALTEYTHEIKKVNFLPILANDNLLWDNIKYYYI